MARSTYTYAIVPVSQTTYDEIRAILVKNGYTHQIHIKTVYHWEDETEVIDMHGLALEVKDARRDAGTTKTPPPGPPAER